MKDRTKPPEYEQQRVSDDAWKPLCSYCQRKRERHLTSNPFGGFVWQFIRPVIKNPIDGYGEE